jgi:hypothetical protein
MFAEAGREAPAAPAALAVRALEPALRPHATAVAA